MENFLVRPIHHDHVPRTGASVYRQPSPPPDVLPVVASTSAEPVPAVGLPAMVPAVLRPHVATLHVAHMALFAQAMFNLAQVAQLWVASMAAQTMVQQQGGGQSMQEQGGRQTAQLAGSQTARHEPAAGAADEAPKSTNRRGKKKQKVKLHSTSVTTLCQIRALRVPAKLDGYQSATGSIFQRTASAEPDLPSTDCDQLPSLVESSDSGGVCFLSCW